MKWRWASHFTGTECAVRGGLPTRDDALIGMRSMPCPLVTEGFRQELLAATIAAAFVPRRGPVDSFHRARGWLSTRFQVPGSHHPRLAVAVTGMYSSLATIAYCDVSSIPVRNKVVKRNWI